MGQSRERDQGYGNNSNAAESVAALERNCAQLSALLRREKERSKWLESELERVNDLKAEQCPSQPVPPPRPEAASPPINKNADLQKSLRKKLEKLKQLSNADKAQVDTLLKQAKERDDLIDMRSRALFTLQSKMVQLENQLQKEKSDWLLRDDEKKNEIEHLRAKVDSAEAALSEMKASHKDALHVLKTEQKQLQDEYKQLKESLLAKEREARQMFGQCGEQKALMCDQENLIASQKESIASQLESIALLKHELEATKADFASKERAHHKAGQGFRLQHAGLVSVMRAWGANVLEKAVGRIQAEGNAKSKVLNEKIDTAAHSLKTLQKKIETISASKRQMETKNQMLIMELNGARKALEDEIKDNESFRQRASHANQELKIRLKEVDDKLSRANEQHKHAMETNASLASELKSAKKNGGIALEQANQLEDAMAALKGENDHMKQMLVMAKKRMEKIEEELVEANKTSNSFRRDLAAQSENYRAELAKKSSEFSSQLQALKEMRNRAEKCIDTLESSALTLEKSANDARSFGSNITGAISKMLGAQEAMEGELTCMRCLQIFNNPVVLEDEKATRCCASCVKSVEVDFKEDPLLSTLCGKFTFAQQTLSALETFTFQFPDECRTAVQRLQESIGEVKAWDIK